MLRAPPPNFNITQCSGDHGIFWINFEIMLKNLRIFNRKDESVATFLENYTTIYKSLRRASQFWVDQSILDQVIVWLMMYTGLHPSLVYGQPFYSKKDLKFPWSVLLLLPHSNVLERKNEWYYRVMAWNRVLSLFSVLYTFIICVNSILQLFIQPSTS